MLDVGTDNVELLEDPQYLGWRHRRIDDDEYFAFVDEFVAAVHDELPDVLLQWEDFATAHAMPILERYRDKLLTFNDDIQGTAAVALGALHGASKVAGRPLSQQQVVMLGAGSAGIGVLDMVQPRNGGAGACPNRMRRHASGSSTSSDCSPTTARTCPTGSASFAQPADRVADWGLSGPAQLADVVHNVDVGVLLGLSTAAGAFTEQIVRELAAKTDRPIIFPLSNPTSRAEAHPAELDEWTDGRALIATGSPFAPLHRDGVERPVAQCNNVYIFPAMGLAVTAAQATRVTDEMMRVAAATPRRRVTRARRPEPSRCCLRGPTFPTSLCALPTPSPFRPSPTASLPNRSDDELAERIAEVRWTPEYPA